MKKLLALLLAIAMLATLCACGKKDKDSDKGGSNDPEAVAEAFAEAYELEDYAALIDLYAYDFEAELKDDALDYYDSEDEFFEEMSDEYDEKITSWKGAYKAVLKEADEYLKGEYGDDYKLKVKATDTEELDEDEIEDIIDYLLDECDGYVDEDAVKDIDEAMDVTVETSISGEDGEDSSTLIVTVVKIDGKWKVADCEYVYDDEEYDYDDDYYYDDDDYYYDDEEYYYDEY